VIVVAPFREMVCELKTWRIGRSVFEVDDYELFVGIGWQEEGRFARWFETEDIAVLCLDSVSSFILFRTITTYVVMSKHQLLSHFSCTSVMPHQELPILLNHPSEHWPFNSTYQASRLPSF
jgi:hypothetical protein